MKELTRFTSRHAVVAFCATLILPLSVSAELYTFVDDDGVIHFTNIADNVPKNAKRPKAKRRSVNTYDWSDSLGVLRRVHKVNVVRFDDLIREAAKYYTLPPALVKAVVAVESSFEPKAVSPAGAQGLMQLMPGTAREMQVANVFEPRENIYGGTRYLRILTNQYQGDIRKTLAAYNAGPKAVAKYNGVPNYPETRKYLRRVLRLYRHYLQHWN